MDSTTTIINDFFFANCTQITSVDLSGLTAVTSIGDNFFRDCNRLTSVDLSALTKVTSIGNLFFYDCRGLTSINLSALTKVTSIGNSFFSECFGLISVDLSGLTAVTSIGDSFFYGCTGLTSVNLSGLTAVQTIGNLFFYGCTVLVTITAKVNTEANGTLSAATVMAITTQIANKFTRLNLTGNGTSLPAWVNNTSMTKNTGATLDLSAMTNLTSPFNFGTSITNTDIKTVILPTNVTTTTISAASTVNVQLANGHQGLTHINLTGNATSLPAWATNGTLTTTDATLDLSAMTNLSAPLNLTAISSDITAVILPAYVTNLTIPSTVTTVSGTTILTILKLTGAPLIPAWATNGSLTATNATLDLIEMTNLPVPLDLAGLNPDIKTVILSNGITPTNTTGWTNSGTTWTR